MKKLLLLIALLVGHLTTVIAQDTIVMNVTEINWEDVFNFCSGTVVVVHADPNCNQFYWKIDNVNHYENPIIIESQVTHTFHIHYFGCTTDVYFGIALLNQGILTPLTNTIWKRYHEPLVIEPVGTDSLGWYSFLWSTGQTSSTIEVTEPGIYSCDFSNLCSSVTRTFIVRDNVELYRATVDLETNLNKATWQVTPEQAEYISEVKVYRDGLFVGNAPYEQGFFLDAIGSDNAARNYQVVGVTPDGEECPFGSYEKGTIHTTYYQDVNSNLNMTWNIPYVEEGAQGTLTYFQICKYDPLTGDITVVDQVNASIIDYTCGVNQFDGGQAVIAAVFSDGKGVEELAFSNLTTDILGVGEDSGTAFRIYPNPSNGTFTVEGAANITVYNVLGQVVATCRDGACTVSTLSGTVAYQFTLPSGIYTVRNSDGIVRKVVVE